MPDLPAMRRDYGAGSPAPDPDLEPSWLDVGWDALLRTWIDDASAGGVTEPNAMTLATVDDRGRPVSRTVLCKDVSAAGVTFFTNRESDKGRELLASPFAAITFAWPRIGRQVNLRGPAAPVSDGVTAAYWRTRPRGSQLGAWSSQQSRPIASRAELELLLERTTARFAEVEEIPVPPFWGGFRVIPEVAEFWQGRTGRLHNRVRATFDDSGWTTRRLQP
jgi:pyridoxamine 5'-phosphate oxidase